MAIALRYAARSDVGLVRSNNQDSGYAGSHLLVVADGMGGHVGGDIASSLAIGELAPLDEESHGSDDALTQLAAAIRSAHRQLLDRVHEEPQLTGMGTTVTALLRAGSRFALAHIGDSRAYLLRDGVLTQITRDHTFVQSLVDEGRLSAAEAEHHPQRSVLMRVLSDIIDDAEPDLSMREARVGDRYLLCSDGLSGVVSHETLRDTLAAGSAPAQTCSSLVRLALRGGAPDNVTCIVADVVAVGGPFAPDTEPAVVGAVSLANGARTRPLSTGSSAERAAALAPAEPAPDGAPDAGEVEAGSRRRRFGAVGRGIVVALVVVLVAGSAYGAWRWTQSQFYVATTGDTVAIFRGLPQDLGPISLSRVAQVADDVPLDELPTYARQRVEEGIVADDEAGAQAIVATLREQVAACRTAVAAQDGPRATPSPSPGASTTATPGASPSPGVSASVSPTPPLVAAGSATPTPTLTPTSTPTPAADAATQTATTDPESGFDLPDPSPEDCGGLS